MYGNKKRKKLILVITVVILILNIFSINVLGVSYNNSNNTYVYPTTPLQENEDLELLTSIFPSPQTVDILNKIVFILLIVFIIVNLILFVKNKKRISKTKKIVYGIIGAITVFSIIHYVLIYWYDWFPDENLVAIEDPFMDFLKLIASELLLIIQLIILIQLVIKIKKSKKEENPKCQE